MYLINPMRYALNQCLQIVLERTKSAWFIASVHEQSQIDHYVNFNYLHIDHEHETVHIVSNYFKYNF